MVSFFVRGGPLMWVLLILVVVGGVQIVRIQLGCTRSRAAGVAVQCRGPFRWLKTVAQVLPATGVLGSLLGAVSAGSAIAKAGHVEPRILAAGASEMLIPAISGLLAGIAMQIARGLLASVVDRQSLRISEQPTEAIG